MPDLDVDEDYDPRYDPDVPHEGHYTRLGGAWFCDTCGSPYCDRA